MNSPWKMAAVTALLLIFIWIGLAHVINPDRFIKRSGKQPTDWRRSQYRVASAVFAGVAVYMLYEVIRKLISN